MDEKSREYARGRMAIYRLSQRLLKALDWLFECEIIETTELFERRRAVELHCEARYRDLKGARSDDKRERRLQIREEESRIAAVCKRPGCLQSAARGQAYCCRDHAPLGYFAERKPAICGLE